MNSDNIIINIDDSPDNLAATRVVVPLQLSSRARNQINHLPKIFWESETKTQKEKDLLINSETNKTQRRMICYANQGPSSKYIYIDTKTDLDIYIYR